MVGSRLAPPVLLDARDSASHVRLAIDDVALVHHDGRKAGNAQAPCFGDALVGGGEAALKVGSSLIQPTLDDGCRLFWVRRKFRRKLRLNPVGFVQRDQPLAAHGLDRMAAVGDDHHVGGEGGWAKDGQSSRQRNGQAESSPA